jgi:SprT protein
VFNFFSTPKPVVPRKIKTTEPQVIEKLFAGKLPGVPVTTILRLAHEYPFNFKITRNRSSKSGDFRAPHNGNPARITVNGDLNPYAFLITTIHELAHFVVHIDHGKRRQRPHGAEWKTAFRELMAPFMFPHIIPPDVLFPLASYLKNPKASSSGDQHLMRALRNHDRQSGRIHLEDLPFDALFRIHNGMVFRKKEKLRTRYTCIHMQTKRTYRISPIAEVILLEENFPVL